MAGQHPGGNQAIGHGAGRFVAGQLPGGGGQAAVLQFAQSTGGLEAHADRSRAVFGKLEKPRR